MTSETSGEPASPAFLGRGVKVDPKIQKIDRVFFRRLWLLCRPFWARAGAWRSWLLVGVIVLANLAAAGAAGRLTMLYQDVNNALVAKHATTYAWLMASYIGFGFAILAGVLFAEYVSGYVKTQWRRWMTAKLIDEYLTSRTYYAITVDGDIDNPDQRIQEEMSPVIDAVMRLPTNVLNSVMNIVVQVSILAFIALPMLIATLAYCAVNAIFTYYIYRPTIRQNWESTVAEADFRFGLLHVRDHAETIAFYRGENGERLHLFDRLSTAVAKQWVLISYQIKVMLADKSFGLLWKLWPALFVAPLYFSGDISFGTIAAATTAATLINSSIETFINFIPVMSKAVPHVVRVAQIREKSEARGVEYETRHLGHLRRNIAEESIGFDNVTLMTPGAERTLFKNLTARIPKGSRLLIAGPTGTGKSSALRAMAGLWNVGHGTILTPPEGKTLYLPQRPYMVLGSLRHQLLYPGNAEVPPTDEEIVAALEEACLEEFVKRHPDLGAEADWGRILSLGEQQRIGFARAYLSGAEYIFVDEATSAIDVDTERRLYNQLLTREMTLVSIGHRPSVFAYHNLILVLRPDGTGEIMPIEQYATGAMRPALQRSAV